MLTLVMMVLAGGAGFVAGSRAAGLVNGGPVGAVLGLVRRLRGR